MQTVAIIVVLAVLAGVSFILYDKLEQNRRRQPGLGADSNNFGKATKEQTHRPYPSRRRMEDRLKISEGLANLQTMFYEADGRNFTQAELDEALQRAQAVAGPRGSRTFPTNRHLFMDPDSGIPKHVMTRHVQEHTQRQEDMRRRRMQTIRKDSGFLVTAKSPGFSWNEGRNEFYCVAVPQVAANQRDTMRGQKMVLKNCYSTAVDELVMRYTNEQELWMQEINTALYDWCLETKKARNNKSVRLNSCNVFDENQVFDLIGIDNTWRSTVDNSLCVTCRSNHCLKEGGTLKYKPCSSDLDGNNKYRTGQAFIYCFLESSCTVDQQTSRLDCIVNERCGDK